VRSESPGDGVAGSASVLHVLWSLGIGGAERAVYQLVLAQRQTGIDAGALVASDLGLYGDRLVEQGVPVETLGQRRGFDVIACLRARPILSNWDTVHFHVAEPLLMLAAARRHARLYYTHRGGAFRYDRKQRLRYKAAGAIMRTRFTGMVGNTAHAADAASDLFAVPRAKIGVVYNGVDWSILRSERDRSDVRAELDLPPDAVLFGTSANLRDWKRIDMVIRVLAQTPRDVVFVVVGDGPARAPLETLARELGVGERVRFTGRRSNVADLLQIFDAFVLPSGPLESFGNSAVEAMGWGLPTIVLEDGGGLVEHIVHGETGVVASGEADMAGWITCLAGDVALRRSIGTRGRDSVREKYTVERMVRGYADLYAAPSRSRL
jgi:glycosyltransferase involved in cell wall biosynthesis